MSKCERVYLREFFGKDRNGRGNGFVPFVGIVAVLQLIVAPSTAQASPPSPQPAASVGETVVISASLPGSDAPTITCTARADNPHQSDHDDTTINYIGVLSCTGGIPLEIAINANMRKDDVLIATNPMNKEVNRYKVQQNRDVPCGTGTYQGFSHWYVKFPPGYRPSTGTGDVFSKRLFLSC